MTAARESGTDQILERPEELKLSSKQFFESIPWSLETPATSGWL